MRRAPACWTCRRYTMHDFAAPGASMPDKGILHDADAAGRSWIAAENYLNKIRD